MKAIAGARFSERWKDYANDDGGVRDCRLVNARGERRTLNEERYKRWTQPFRQEPKMLAVLLMGNKLETYLFYVMYPLLLVLELVFCSSLLLKSFLVPAIAFALVTLMRRVLNQPRPYEELCIQPLIAKDTKGKSFPSRHVFSCYMIAMAWLPFNTAVGVVLLLLGLDMMFIRVVGGVHYPQDVLAGALCGILAGIVGFYAIP